MSLKSGFFESVDGDRTYTAEEFSHLLEGIITDGVYKNVGERFKISTSYEENCVIVDTGRAWFNFTWIKNNAPEIIVADYADIIYDRIDALVFDIDYSDEVRAGSIQFVTGSPSKRPERPELIKEDGHWQYPLAYVFRPANDNLITAENIILMIGTDECPYVMGIVGENINDRILTTLEQMKANTNPANVVSPYVINNLFGELEYYTMYNTVVNNDYETETDLVDINNISNFKKLYIKGRTSTNLNYNNIQNGNHQLLTVRPLIMNKEGDGDVDNDAYTNITVSGYQLKTNYRFRSFGLDWEPSLDGALHVSYANVYTTTTMTSSSKFYLVMYPDRFPENLDEISVFAEIENMPEGVPQSTTITVDAVTSGEPNSSGKSILRSIVLTRQNNFSSSLSLKGTNRTFKQISYVMITINLDFSRNPNTRKLILDLIIKLMICDKQYVDNNTVTSWEPNIIPYYDTYLPGIWAGESIIPSIKYYNHNDQLVNTTSAPIRFTSSLDSTGIYKGLLGFPLISWDGTNLKDYLDLSDIPDTFEDVSNFLYRYAISTIFEPKGRMGTTPTGVYRTYLTDFIYISDLDRFYYVKMIGYIYSYSGQELPTPVYWSSKGGLYNGATVLYMLDKPIVYNLFDYRSDEYVSQFLELYPLLKTGKKSDYSKVIFNVKWDSLNSVYLGYEVICTKKQESSYLLEFESYDQDKHILRTKGDFIYPYDPPTVFNDYNTMIRYNSSNLYRFLYNGQRIYEMYYNGVKFYEDIIRCIYYIDVNMEKTVYLSYYDYTEPNNKIDYRADERPFPYFDIPVKPGYKFYYWLRNKPESNEFSTSYNSWNQISYYDAPAKSYASYFKTVSGYIKVDINSAPSKFGEGITVYSLGFNNKANIYHSIYSNLIPKPSGWDMVGFTYGKEVNSDTMSSLPSPIQTYSDVYVYVIFRKILRLDYYDGNSTVITRNYTRLQNTSGKTSDPQVKLDQRSLSGWTPRGWALGSAADAAIALANGATITLTEDRVYYGCYQATVTLTTVVDGVTKNYNATKYFNGVNAKNPTFTVPNPTKSGYTFNGWKYENGNSAYDTISNLSLSSNTKLVASFSADSKTITLNATLSCDLNKMNPCFEPPAGYSEVKVNCTGYKYLTVHVKQAYCGVFANNTTGQITDTLYIVVGDKYHSGSAVTSTGWNVEVWYDKPDGRFNVKNFDVEININGLTGLQKIGLYRAQTGWSGIHDVTVIIEGTATLHN